MAKILLLEDDPRMRQFLLDAVGKFLKHEVASASGLQDALPLAQRERFELMLLDMRLRDGTAWDFCRALPESSREIPKWLLAGARPLQWDGAAWAALGVRGCLVKPVALELLTETINSCLKSPRP